MFRRFLCLSLTVCLILFSTLTSFAATEYSVTSGPALLSRSVSPDSLKASGSGQQVYINESGSWMYYNGSTTSGGSILSGGFADFFSRIYESIARSAQGIVSALISRNVNYYYSPSTSDGGQSVNFEVGSSSWFNGITNAIGEFYREFYKFQYKVFNNGLPAQMMENSSINWTQDYIWKKWLTATSGQVPTISQGGVFRQQTINWSSMSVLGAIEALFYYPVTGITNGVSLLVRDVRDNDAALDDYLYDKDLQATLIPRTTIWQNMRDFWNNASLHLSRLDFVLANDDDIALRQSQADNVQSLRDNMTSGDISLSPSKIAGSKNIGSSISDSFSSDASIDDGLSILNNGSQSWSWFSNDVSNSLDSSPSTRLLKSGRSATPYLDSYYREVAPYVD